MKYIYPLCWTLFVLIIAPINSHAQFSKKWSTWKELYKDQDITVELSIYTPKPNSCIDKNKKFKFKYRVTGKYKDARNYLNWKISYIDCNEIRYYQQNSLDLWKKEFHDISGGIIIEEPDKQFTGDQIYKEFYEVQILRSKEEDSGVLPPLKSTAPDKIQGLDKIFMGETIELNVNGGKLGEDARWVWYIGECGKRKIKEGKSIKLNIQRKTTVFVRAEGKNNKTKCVQKTIDVDPRSRNPDSIVGETNICSRESTTLNVKGGSLGAGAQWVWYEDGCGLNKVGTGSRISVQPRKTKEYYVRAEGKFNTTDCVKVWVNVSFPVELPSQIKVAGSTSICQGASIKLSIKGKSNSTAYKWYRGTCGGKFVGTGLSINVKPYQTTTYFVRAEGICNETACLSQEIRVASRSSLPSSIEVKNTKKGKILQISKGARLTSGAKWKWYKEGCGLGSVVGSGASIKIKDSRKPIRYYVRAEGKCPNINCTSILIKPVENVKRRFQSFNKIHYRASIGFDYNLMEDINTYSAYNIDRLEGIGFRGEFAFYPLIKDFFSVGVLSSASIGGSRYFLDGGEVPDTNPLEVDKYFYTHFTVGGEVALGFPAIKILTGINKEIQNNKLDRTIGRSTINFDNTLNRDYLGIGLRLGSYKKGRNIDVMYLLYRNNQNAFSEFTNTFSDLENRLTGFQFSWKTHNRFTFKVNVFSPITHQQAMMSKTSQEDISFYSTLLINLDRFY